MKRKSEKCIPPNQESFILKALHWAQGHKVFSYFKSNDSGYPYEQFHHFISVGTHVDISFGGKNDFTVLEQFVENSKDYLIGHFTYDLKNQIEKLKSHNPDVIGFSSINFYVPEHIISFGESVVIESFDDPKSVYNEIINQTLPIENSHNTLTTFKPSTSKSEYINTVEQLKKHIEEGDIYEINYCQQFVSHQADIEPIATFLKLIKTSPTPFSCLYKRNNQYVICASPERFIKKVDQKLISQPIKGTARRGESIEEDLIIKNNLSKNEKELAENMMIVDLVRNDLAKSCNPGSVNVEEMFGIYTFNQLHQMISTVTGQLQQNTNGASAIKNAFPMGSMTGAPKIKVMELIEKYENFKRGIYAGSIGYFLPNGDFDFNVVIRSIIYDATSKIASISVGSAITCDSDSEAEYEECILKAKAVSSIFRIDKY